MAELLIKYGADCHKTCNVRAQSTTKQKTVFSLFHLSFSLSLSHVQDGSSVLHQAANNGHCDTVKLLLTKYKIPIHVTDNVGS